MFSVFCGNLAILIVAFYSRNYHLQPTINSSLSQSVYHWKFREWSISCITTSQRSQHSKVVEPTVMPFRTLAWVGPCIRWGPHPPPEGAHLRRRHQDFSTYCQALFPVALMSAFPCMLSTSILIGCPQKHLSVTLLFSNKNPRVMSPIVYVLWLLVIIVRLHCTATYTDAAYCYRPSSVVCWLISVCWMVTVMSPTKTAETIEILFSLWAPVGSRNHN